MKNDLSRRIHVTLLVSTLGAALGAACGATIAVGLDLVSGGLATVRTESFWSTLLAAEVGAATGCGAAPLLGWSALRHVPLGRAVLWTSLGTVLGGIAGELSDPFLPYVRGAPTLLVGGILGCVVAGVIVRAPSRRGAHVDINEHVA